MIFALKRYFFAARLTGAYVQVLPPKIPRLQKFRRFQAKPQNKLSHNPDQLFLKLLLYKPDGKESNSLRKQFRHHSRLSAMLVMKVSDKLTTTSHSENCQLGLDYSRKSQSNSSLSTIFLSTELTKAHTFSSYQYFNETM